MMTTDVLADGAATTISPVRYPAGWFDRFSDWLEHLPGPWWAPYLGMAGLGSGGFILVLARLGSPPGPGRLPFNIFFGSQPALALFTTAAVKRSSAQAMRRFRPLVQGDESYVGQISYQLLVSPSGPAWAVSVALTGIMTAIMVIFANLGTVVPGLIGPPQARIWVAGVLAILWWCYSAPFYHVARQLVIIRRLLSQVHQVELYHLDPVYAFSSTTALAAILLTINNYLWYATQPALLSDPFSVAMGIFLVVVALATFVWPLWGVHQLLQREKSQRLAAAAAAFKHLTDVLHQRVGEGRLDKMDDINRAMSSLDLERNSLLRIPTWPWHPETLRGILAALLLPIAVWLVQFFLGRALIP
jgi:hypothetical protein